MANKHNNLIPKLSYDLHRRRESTVAVSNARERSSSRTTSRVPSAKTPFALLDVISRLACTALRAANPSCFTSRTATTALPGISFFVLLFSPPVGYKTTPRRFVLSFRFAIPYSALRYARIGESYPRGAVTKRPGAPLSILFISECVEQHIWSAFISFPVFSPFLLSFHGVPSSHVEMRTVDG